MEITEQIDLLIELQKLDIQIYRLNRRREDIPVLIKNLEGDFKKKGEGLKEEGEDLKALLVKEKEKENDLTSKEEVIKKCQTQLYQIKTNKEYQAMQHEIEGHKADKSVLEDEMITIFDEVDEKKKRISRLKAEHNDEENKMNAEKEKMNSEIREIEARLNILNAERSELAAKVEKGMLAKYERILKGKDGLAMVPVREDACGGCHLNLPPQVINEINMRKDLVFCESCARILYIER